jgi:hypothetical protein
VLIAILKFKRMLYVTRTVSTVAKSVDPSVGIESTKNLLQRTDNHMCIIYTSLALLLPLSITLIWRITRRELYRNKSSRTQIVDVDGLIQNPDLLDVFHNPTIQEISRLALDSHRRAKEAQGRYQDAISLAIGCVFCAFLIFSIEVSFKHNHKVATQLAYTYETLLLLCSVALFKFSRCKMKTWINERATAELRRQRYFVAVITSTSRKWQPNELNGDFSPELVAWPNLASYGTDRISQRVQELSIEVREPLCSLAVEGEISLPLVMWYQNHRIQRQVEWFSSSVNRVEKFLSFREKLLIVAFIVAVLSGATKALYYWTGLVPWFEVVGPALTFVSQISLAITAGMAAFLLSQNSQYLIQRYRKQLISIESMRRLVSPPNSNFAEQMIKFETLIGDELVDFISQLESFHPEISL